jgi:hypothetical protein
VLTYDYRLTINTKTKMAIVTDLTFEQINDAAIADSEIGEAIFSFNNGILSLNIGKLTGDTFTGLENLGVVESMFKLRKLCGEAQTAVNAEIANNPSEQLSSFPPFTFGIPSAQGLVAVTQVQTVQLPLMANTVVGTN